MRRCTRCVTPETWEGITFDEEGVCSICREYEKEEQFDMNEREKMLRRILEKYKQRAIETGNKYDCLVGYSGGKDTAYTLWAMVKKYGMRPLAVTFDHGFPLSPEGAWNLNEFPKKLGCDHIKFAIGNGLRNALCHKGSEINGDFCWHCHVGIVALLPRISLQWDIPLQIWGEPSAMYQDPTAGLYKYEDMEEKDKEHYEKRIRGMTPEMVKPEGYGMRDLLPFMWPETDFELKAICLGSYQKWDQREHVRIITEEGWKHYQIEGTYVDWDKVDCLFEPVRDWQKFIKRGFGRTTFQASKDIRDGLIDREEALRLVEKHDGKRPTVLDTFLNEVDMSEEEFMTITKKHIVTSKEK